MTDMNTLTPTPEACAQTIQSLVDYCATRGLIGWADRVWAYNTVLDCVAAPGPAPATEWVLSDKPHTSVLNPSPTDDYDLEAALALISEVAVAHGAAEDTASGRDRIAMRVMGALMPRPSEVATEFRGRLDVGERHAATDWFYRMCCDCGYVRHAAIARNIAWGVPTQWGDLEITINLSKPEKDPREIAAAGAAKNTGEVYPACQLCIENEGYPGRSAASGSAHPARQNLRIVPIELGGERWGFQYSPYAYFNEHCIAMSTSHRPMHIDRAAVTCLLDFVDALPHYFIGSIDGYPDVEGAVVRWPLSVLRLRSNDRTQLIDAAEHVINAWRSWTDESVGVIARTDDGVPHNTVTPIARRVDSAGHAGGDRYELCLALRCNIATDEHPLGVFHPHAEYHHIKKENIGLIEVMGLAILPPRLKDEMAAVECVLIQGANERLSSEQVLDRLSAADATASHAAWAAEVYATRHDEIGADSTHDIVLEEVGIVFGHVLENAGVFKWDGEGRAAQQRFIGSL